jgi:hypothetical protein
MAINWQEDLATGVEIIDSQHKGIFARFVTFTTACNDRPDRGQKDRGQALVIEKDRGQKDRGQALVIAIQRRPSFSSLMQSVSH